MLLEWLYQSRRKEELVDPMGLEWRFGRRKCVHLTFSGGRLRRRWNFIGMTFL